MKYVIGNWKAHKSFSQAEEWISSFKSNDLSIFKDSVSIIICPPFPWIPVLHQAFKHESSIQIGAQDVSAYASGQHTGETPAEALAGMVQYTLVGHSERRREKHETHEEIHQKILHATQNTINPILLVRSSEDVISENVQFIAYEPVEAIGTGHPVGPDEVISMKATLQLPAGVRFLYGGSVNAENVRNYVQRSEIDGVVPGTASLNPTEFYNLARNCIPA